MLQRIQTLYLLAIVVLSGFTLYLPVADLVNTAKGLYYLVDYQGINLLQAHQITLESSVWGLTAITLIMGVFAAYALVSYKNRVKQIRLSVVNMLFMVGYYLLLFIYIWFASRRLEADWSLRLVSVFPLICLVLNYLAIGAIGKDEKLVKSLDRIR